MMRNILYILFLAGSISACTPKTSSSEFISTEGNSDMLLEQVQPAVASPGTMLTLYGKNLKDSIIVLFNDVPADSVFNKSSLALNVMLPTLATHEKINVKVITKDKKFYSNGAPLTVIAAPEKVRTLYWTTHNLYQGIANDGRISVEKLFEDDHPRGLVFDSANNEMYWGNGFGQVFKGNIKTKETKEILRLGYLLSDLIIDNKKEWLYYTQENAIKRVSLMDTSKHEILYKDRSEPLSLKISYDDKTLYWCEYGSLQVLRGSVEGGEATVLVTPEEGLSGPRAIDIDETNNKLYIADAPAVSNSTLFVSNLTGDNVKKIAHTTDGIGEMVNDVAIDNIYGYLYWMNSKGRTQQYKIDGSIMRSPINGQFRPEIVFQPINYGFQLSLQ